jgi:CMP-N-acetylneuraminic acid synthetase
MSNKYFLDEVEVWKEFSLFEQKYNKNYETFIELEKNETVDVDELADWDLAEFLLKARRQKN